MYIFIFIISLTFVSVVMTEFDSEFHLVEKQDFQIPDHLMIHDWAFTDSHYILFGNRIKLDVGGKQ